MDIRKTANKTLAIVGSHWKSADYEHFNFSLCERTASGLLTVALVNIDSGGTLAQSIKSYSHRMPAIVRLAKSYKNRSVPKLVK